MVRASHHMRWVAGQTDDAPYAVKTEMVVGVSEVTSAPLPPACIACVLRESGTWWCW